MLGSKGGAFAQKQAWNSIDKGFEFKLEGKLNLTLKPARK